MTREQIIKTMLTREYDRLFYTMELGGSMRQLSKMEAEGLISSQQRHMRGRQRDWFLTEAQYLAAKITPENRHPEVDMGKAVGAEFA